MTQNLRVIPRSIEEGWNEINSGGLGHPSSPTHGPAYANMKYAKNGFAHHFETHMGTKRAENLGFSTFLKLHNAICSKNRKFWKVLRSCSHSNLGVGQSCYYENLNCRTLAILELLIQDLSIYAQISNWNLITNSKQFKFGAKLNEFWTGEAGKWVVRNRENRHKIHIKTPILPSSGPLALVGYKQTRYCFHKINYWLSITLDQKGLDHRSKSYQPVISTWKTHLKNPLDPMWKI